MQVIYKIHDDDIFSFLCFIFWCFVYYLLFFKLLIKKQMKYYYAIYQQVEIINDTCRSKQIKHYFCYILVHVYQFLKISLNYFFLKIKENNYFANHNIISNDYVIISFGYYLSHKGFH